ncbi:MAG: extracellular solute-binding protein [Hyphomicrobiaceae bacterium]
MPLPTRQSQSPPSRRLRSNLNLMHRLALILVVATLPITEVWSTALAGEPTHGIAMHGKPALPPDFEHLPHARPDAPKGGSIRLGQTGTFDTLNPFSVLGVAAAGMRDYVYESLMARSVDEPFTLYGLIAKSIEVPEDRSSITFHIDPDARFSDGHPVTAGDVVFSWQTLKEQGQPYHRAHYGTVARAEVLSERSIRFVFKPLGNREAPLLLALMPILPSHVLTAETFARTSLAPPVATGPYVVASVEAGRNIVYRRNPDWWGRNKPVNAGRFNIGEIRYDYFRDETAMFEAFKAGEADLRIEEDAGRWAEGYAIPAVREGRITLLEPPTAVPAGMTALVMNARRPMLADPRVRQALALALDFEWINRNLFHGIYQRTESFFARSELSSHGRPADAEERRLLAPFAASLPAGLMAGTFGQPKSDGSGFDRQNMRRALALLQQAGYRATDGKLVDAKSGQQLSFEMLAATRAQERLFQAFARPLERLGVAPRIRLIDSAQLWARLKRFDFDMVQWYWSASLSPGNEQFNRWSTASADIEHSLNYPGIKSPAVDAMIDAVLKARERPPFVAAVRALDRALLAGHYVIPLYHPKGLWIAHWSNLAHPDRVPLSGFALDTWWVTPPK